MAKKPPAPKAKASPKAAANGRKKASATPKTKAGSDFGAKHKPSAADKTKSQRAPVRRRSSAKPTATSATGRSGKDTRFKPGQSGNPKGRPRKDRSLLKHIEDELDAEMQVTEGGKTIRLTKREALAKAMVHNALKGDHKSLQALLRLLPLPKADDGEEHAAIPLETVLRFLTRKGELPDDNKPAKQTKK